MPESYLLKMREFFESLGIETYPPIDHTSSGFTFTAALTPRERPRF